MNIARWPVTILTSLVCLLSSPAHAEFICWSDNQRKRIQCALPDGSQQADLYINLRKPLGMALDKVNGRLYWTDGDNDQIVAVDLVDHATPAVFAQLPLASGVRGMGIAPSIGKVYWVAENIQKLQRANLDGTGVEDLPVPPGSYFDVEVDEANAALYWINGNQIWQGNLDGTNASAIINGQFQPYYLALDTSAGKVYWTNFASNTIGRANLDGTGIDVGGVVSGLPSGPQGIVIDPPSGKIYWTLDSGAVQRANLDGSNVETVLTTIDGTWDITILQSLPITQVVPTVSSWGFFILALSLLTVGSIMLKRDGGRSLRPNV